jgi:hypothetical protein
MPKSSVKYIQVINRTNFEYQLRIPAFNFTRQIQKLARYSLPLPFNFGATTVGEIRRFDGQIMTFAINQNGELSVATKGLSIGTVGNGDPLDAFGVVSIGVDQFQNNILYIGPELPSYNFPVVNLPFY